MSQSGEPTIKSLMPSPLKSAAAIAVPNFSSLMAPFAIRADIRFRVVPFEALADAISEKTWLVVFSLVQSATGVVADVDAILEAAARHNTLTFCDTTQATGVLPM